MEIELVLSGGAAVAIYNDKYVSLDIDLIIVYSAKTREIKNAMEEISFVKEGKHYRHSDSRYIVEFVAGPLSIGKEPVRKIDELKLATGTLKLLSPTDCVKDRLAAYYFWDDGQGLAQAILISKVQHIDIDEVERWSDVEGMLEKFDRIKSQFV